MAANIQSDKVFDGIWTIGSENEVRVGGVDGRSDDDDEAGRGDGWGCNKSHCAAASALRSATGGYEDSSGENIAGLDEP